MTGQIERSDAREEYGKVSETEHEAATGPEGSGHTDRGQSHGLSSESPGSPASAPSLTPEREAEWWKRVIAECSDDRLKLFIESRWLALDAARAEVARLKKQVETEIGKRHEAEEDDHQQWKQNAELRALLARAEWWGPSRTCPCCHQAATLGHVPGCDLARLLGSG